MVWLLAYLSVATLTFWQIHGRLARYKPTWNGEERLSTTIGYWQWAFTGSLLWPLYWPYRLFIAPLVVNRLQRWAEKGGFHAESVEPTSQEEGEHEHPIFTLTSIVWDKDAFVIQFGLGHVYGETRTNGVAIAVRPDVSPHPMHLWAHADGDHSIHCHVPNEHLDAVLKALRDAALDPRPSNPTTTARNHEDPDSGAGL